MTSKRVFFIPTVFFVWFIVIQFPVSFLNIVLCSVASGAVFYLSGWRKTAADDATVPPNDNFSPNLETVIRIVRDQLRSVEGTELKTPLSNILDNLTEIERAIEAEPSYAENNYLRRFCDLYVDYSRGLVVEYLILNQSKNHTGSIAKILDLYAERFHKLNDITAAILDDIYGRKTIDFEAENRALEQVFIPLAQKSIFSHDL